CPLKSPCRATSSGRASCCSCASHPRTATTWWSACAPSV
ncbi:MAG: hypothetical protein AVDCRST_MAG69-81, partial [uncultured Solirubrobacteraceae bacterium]